MRRPHKFKVEQIIGIEPTSSAWKADALTVVLYLHWSRIAESNRHIQLGRLA